MVGKPGSVVEREALQGPATVQHGRYAADDGEWHLELRVDLEGDQVISGDVSRTSEGKSTWWAFRTTPGSVVAPGSGPWPIQWPSPVSVGAEAVGSATGTISLRVGSADPAEIAVQICLQTPSAGLPDDGRLAFTARWLGRGMRGVTLRVACQDRVTGPGAVNFDERELTYAACLADAGIDVTVTRATSLPDKPEWSVDDVFSALHRMTASQKSTEDQASWNLNLLVLKKAERSNLLGIMFDVFDDHQRQAAALFVDPIRNTGEPEDADRRLIQIAVHELGHTLNLRHPFEADVARPTSTSFMMYDWLYRGGQSKAYWDDFRFTFDSHELSYLRHGPREELIPGGAPFGAARYWPSPTPGEFSPIAAPVTLWLTPPAGGVSYARGQSVFLGISLRNTGPTPITLPRTVLDPKSGLVRVFIRRQGTGKVEPFVPIMVRCYDARTPDDATLQPGESIHSNLNLAFGSTSFPFAEAGTYEVHVDLDLPAATCDGRPVIAHASSPVLTLTVRDTESLGQQEAATLRSSDAGRYLALGGATVLAEAEESLLGVVAQRAEVAATKGEPNQVDGIAAGVHRAVGISRSRGEDVETKVDDAIYHLERALSPGAAEHFDPHTLASTQSLVRSLKKARGDADFRPTKVVVDLAITPKGLPRGTPAVLRHEGVLCIDRDGDAVVAIAPLDQTVTPDHSEIRATVAVPAKDGLIEVVRASEVDLVRQIDGAPMFTKLSLSRRSTPAGDIAVTPEMLSALGREFAWTPLADTTQPSSWASVGSPETSATAAPTQVSGAAVDTDTWGWVCALVNKKNCYQPDPRRRAPDAQESTPPCAAFVLPDEPDDTQRAGEA